MCEPQANHSGDVREQQPGQLAASPRLSEPCIGPVPLRARVRRRVLPRPPLLFGMDGWDVLYLPPHVEPGSSAYQGSTAPAGSSLPPGTARLLLLLLLVLFADWRSATSSWDVSARGLAPSLLLRGKQPKIVQRSFFLGEAQEDQTSETLRLSNSKILTPS